jgi:hypothetical protein
MRSPPSMSGWGRSVQTATDNAEAWDAIHDRLPDGWRAGRPSYNPATRRLQIAVMPPSRGRRKVWTRPEYVVGEGDSELEALRDLAARLLPREWAGPAGAVALLLRARTEARRRGVKKPLVLLLAVRSVAAACSPSTPTSALAGSAPPASPAAQSSTPASSAPAAAQQQASAAPSATTQAVATTPVALTMAQAKDAYRTAARKGNAVLRITNGKFKTAKTLAQLRRIYAQVAASEATFIADLKAVIWPAQVAADIRALVRAEVVLHRTEVEASKARSWTAMDEAAATIRGQDQHASDLAAIVRDDLGLPANARVVDRSARRLASGGRSNRLRTVPLVSASPAGPFPWIP